MKEEADLWGDDHIWYRLLSGEMGDETAHSEMLTVRMEWRNSSSITDGMRMVTIEI